MSDLVKLPLEHASLETPIESLAYSLFDTAWQRDLVETVRTDLAHGVEVLYCNLH